MATYASILADAMGVEANESNLWDILRRGGSEKKMLEALLGALDAGSIDVIPEKGSNEFRPGFFGDYEGGEVTAHERERIFVSRALSVADRLALEDEISQWAEEPDRDKFIDTLTESGYPESNTITLALRRIARYSSLEESGIIVYVPPAPRPSAAEVHAALSAISGRSLVEFVKAHDPFVGSGKPGDEYAYNLGLLWLRELSSLLEHATTFSQYLDLYLPDWIGGSDVFTWAIDNGYVRQPPELAQLRSARLGSKLFQLPTPSMNSLNSMTLRQMTEFRSADPLAQWRQSVREGIQQIRDASDLVAADDLIQKLQSDAAATNKQTSKSPTLSKFFKEQVLVGLAMAGYAEVTKQPVGTTIASGAVADATKYVIQRVGSWLSTDPYTGADGLPQSVPQEQKAIIKPFMDINLRKYPYWQFSPTPFLQSPDGRATAALFDRTFR